MVLVIHCSKLFKHPLFPNVQHPPCSHSCIAGAILRLEKAIEYLYRKGWILATMHAGGQLLLQVHRGWPAHCVVSHRAQEAAYQENSSMWSAIKLKQPRAGAPFPAREAQNLRRSGCVPSADH